MKTPNLFLLLLLVSALSVPALAGASDIRIENAYFIHNSRSDVKEPHVVFTVTWDNSWRNDRNHDAAWVFMKFVGENGGFRHITIAEDGYEVVRSSGPTPEIVVSDDGTGLFVMPGEEYRGTVSWRIKVKIAPSTFSSFNPGGNSLFVDGVEMVYIPTGGFTLGDPDPAALSFASFFKSDGDGNPNGLYQISSSEQEISIGPNDGSLYYRADNQVYQGDQTGVVPASFPNGFDAFYIMKYETQQGQYADFLNTLSAGQTHMRAPFGGKDYYKNRGTIRRDHGRYVAADPARPANYITWDDGAAWADWAALRPMTELEYTKAARGPGTPIEHEYPWNTGTKEQLQRFVNADGALVNRDGIDESQLSDSNRPIFGASYYWVMDLAGSVWEKCVTIGNEIGRRFVGSHGDGRLTGYGSATNSDWPRGIDEEGGYGYRGGGFYYNDRPHTEFNPHSPIAYRPFGSWAGGTRSVAYSNRYVRTAPN